MKTMCSRAKAILECTRGVSKNENFDDFIKQMQSNRKHPSALILKMNIVL